MPYTYVNDSTQIDLDRHALIEASAGTGKTYTIENLVVRFLKEKKDIALENILIVTFTEKATGELKIRIRDKLEDELKISGENNFTSQKIKDTLDAFDTASIYTIHGFCHTVLKDFAFENSTLLNNEVVNDLPLFETLLKEQMRRMWPQIYKDSFHEILSISGFGNLKDRFFSTITDIARQTFRPGVGDEIRPHIGDKDISQIKTEIHKLVIGLKAGIGSPPGFSEEYNRLNINARTKQSLMEKIVIPLETYLAEIDENDFQLIKLADLINRIRQVKSTGRNGIESLLPGSWLKKGANPEVCPNLNDIVEKIIRLDSVLTGLANHLTIQAVIQLQRDVAQVKRQNGWISYEDMLSQVESAVYGVQAPILLEKLRKRYRVAFVDEFQDTDPVQWRIFRKIFLEDPTGSHKNLLFLIGDPKQAIYSFRGADVYAYLDARDKMEKLAAGGMANLYSLATNWRSMKELIQVFNDLFCRREWFPPQEEAGSFEIGYQIVKSPGEDVLPSIPVADKSLRPALNIVDLRDYPSPKIAKSELTKFIAAEIRYLLRCGGIKIRSMNGKARSLDTGDICILVRSRSDVLLLESELKNLGIPYSFYKKPGLFVSDEAVYLSLLFHAILDPGNSQDVKKALLTPFLNFQLSDLYDYEILPAVHPLKQLLFQWNDYARSGKWGMLFQSLMEDSGLLFRESESYDWDRKQTNYRQIFEYLEMVAYRQNLDFQGLASLLDGHRKHSADAADADIHQIETEERKVQIMTMHVSKGLQFPVVFIAGGFTQPAVDNYHVYHVYDKEDTASGSRKIIDLSRRENEDRHEREKTDEDKRLFYVALTRAQFKLYLPFYPYSKSYRWVGPVCKFFADSIASAFPENSNNAAAAWLAPGIHVESDDNGFTDDQSKNTKDHPEHTRELLPPVHNFQRRKPILESFSSLNGRILQGPDYLPQNRGFQAASEKEDDESHTYFDSAGIQADSRSEEMPGGADIGSMFHDIIEHINFDIVVQNADALLKATETRDIIVAYMEMYRVDERWRGQVCRIIANTLTTPISAVGDKFILGKIKKEDRIHEVEFYYPIPLPANKDVEMPDCELKQGYIRGFVDMIFRNRNRFYIADWKSNRLEAGYGYEALETDMDNAGYHLQYKLYTIALMRWLEHTQGIRFDLEKQFGGIFYFYLRGMGTGNGNGIYYISPEKVGRLEHLEEEILDIIHDH